MERSRFGIIRTPIGIKHWMAEMPSVEAVRPSCCPRCRRPSRPVGRSLGLHGHGVVGRDLWGPLSPDEAPEFHDVKIRRFRCQTCGSVIRVGPAEILPHRRYGGGAILVALTLWALEDVTPTQVRESVSPWRHVAVETTRRWPTLERWGAAAKSGLGWPLRRPLRSILSIRAAAGALVRSLVAALPNPTAGEIDLDLVFLAARQTIGGVR